MSRSMYSSRILALAESMSSFLPVSSHHELRISALTLKPMLTISWMASVISSSPRQDGFYSFYGFVDFVGEEVSADYGEVAHGGFGFLDEFDYVAFFV